MLSFAWRGENVTIERNEGTTLLGDALTGNVVHELERLLQMPLAGGLYLVATPIGNLGDVSLRTLAVLGRAEQLYAEDTRHSRTLLAHYGLNRPLRSYHEHNAERERPRILEALAKGSSVAVISDAGTPLISDPGYKLVRAAVEAGVMVTCIPGPSAAIAALVVAGLPTDTFLFAGFLPTRSSARRARLEELKSVPATLLFFETAGRLAECLADMAAVLGTREAVVARELTKLHEEVRRGRFEKLQEWTRGHDVRGEIVVAVGPPAKTEASDSEIAEALRPLLASESLRDAVRAAADALGAPRARVYDIALALKAEAGK